MNPILGFLRRAAGQNLPRSRGLLRRAMDDRQIIAEDTISRTPEIIAATPGASADSTFQAHQLPPLTKDACPNFPPYKVRIEGLDSFTTARKYIQIDPTIRGKVAVLNLASDIFRAGQWRQTLSKTQVRRLPLPLPSGTIMMIDLSVSDNRKRHFATLPLCTSPSRKNITLGQTSDQVQTQEFILQQS